ncbi:MAG: tryptophan synthase subunit alpha [Alphaproteobacteria bacterium]|nr:tryptophan synthase subunit alpha [Alphaproteobacteria bacterium]
MSAARLEAAIRNPRGGHGIALMPYLTAGYPEREGFPELLARVGAIADAIEIGVPFTDPMADGTTIQETSRRALENGVTLPWILDTVKHTETPAACVLMSYFNPLLAYGLERLVVDAADAGVCGFIVPDLPLEEAGPFRELCEAQGLALVMLVTPVTAPERLKRVCAASSGFVYAVTVTGVTGTSADPAQLVAYLTRLRAVTNLPVCAGFGIRSREDVARLEGVAHGAIVGTAMLDALRDGRDPVRFLESLRS